MHLHASNKVQGWNSSSSVKSWKICIQSDTIALDSLHMGLWSRENWKWKHRCCRNTSGDHNSTKSLRTVRMWQQDSWLVLLKRGSFWQLHLVHHLCFYGSQIIIFHMSVRNEKMGAIGWLKQQSEVFFTFRYIICFMKYFLIKDFNKFQSI